MKIFADESAANDVVLLLTKREALALSKVLERGISRKPDPKPMRKSENAYKIADQIINGIPIH